MSLPDQNCILACANMSFYAFYTTKSQLVIFNSHTTQLIKSGVVLRDICMLAANAKGMRLATLTTRGQIQCFKLKDRQALDSCTLLY